MKKAVVRDNVRNIKPTGQSGKNPHSQSPAHKKLLKKIEGIQKNATNTKNDFSLQDKYVHTEQQEEAQDFRVEIERRFKKAISNQEFRFPLHNRHSSDTHSQSSSSEDSLDSLKYVTVYDLASQNKPKKPKQISQKIAFSTDRARIHHEDTVQTSSTSNFIETEQDETDNVPLETKIRDKSSETYKKLIKMLESNRMFSHNSTNPKPESNLKSQSQQKPQPKYQNFYDESEHGPCEQDDVKKSYYTARYQETEQTFEASSRDQSKYKDKLRNSDTSHANSRMNTTTSNRPTNSREGQKNLKLFESSSPRKIDPSQTLYSHTGDSHQMTRTESTLKKTLSYDKTTYLRPDSSNYSTNTSSRVKT